jgi:regulatory LuxR family protein
VSWPQSRHSSSTAVRCCVIEGGVGLGKTSLVDAACLRAAELGFEVLRSRGSELEMEYAFGLVRQLFERRLAQATESGTRSGPPLAEIPCIVRLAADGRSNREIAHELYITLKTLEGHLSRAYCKLDIEGCAQLVLVVESEKSKVPPS